MKRRRHAIQPEAAVPAAGSFRRQALIVFTVAAAVRLAHLWYFRRSPFFSVLMGDSRQYDAWATTLASGDWIGREVFYQAPLYPYCLGLLYSIFGRDLLIVHVVQVLLGAVACVAIAVAAARLFSPGAGVIAGLLMAFYAPAIFLEALIQKSILDSVLVSLAVLLMAMLVGRPSHRALWAGLGATLGALSLTRENALVLVLVALVWAGLARWRQPMARRLDVASAGALLAGLLLILGPFLIRNAVVGGGLYLTTAQLGPNLYIGNNARATGTYQGLREGWEDPAFEREDATALAEHAVNRQLTPAEVSSFWLDRTFDEIAQDPGRWLRLLGRKAVMLFNATELMDTEAQESHAEWSPVLRAAGWFAHFGTLLPFALVGVLVSWPQRGRFAVLYIMAVAYGASVVLFYVVARYRFPILPFLIPLAAAALAALPEVARTGSRRLQAAAVALCVVAAAIAHTPVLASGTMRAITETNLGTALQEQGRLEDAIAHYRRAIAISPEYGPAHNNLGQAFRALGRPDEAIAAFRRALAIRPDVPEVHYNLATVLVEEQRFEESLPHYAASEHLPATERRHNNHGAALAAVGRLDDAIREYRAALAIAPDAVKTLKNLGDAFARQGRYAEALARIGG